ncbi:cell wall hydrolase [Methylobacterium sp. WSM2598]|uniref:cell wall hydrolase n=1 Tax=Methylobacterium sp. WSM2598 TaxID=398261 RepID=UPI00037EC530|nr:cell wall hydrolase [Methylobacterium sp. WSM2598]
MRWIGAATAPWLVAGGVLVSFTAAAGVDSSFGASTVALLSAHASPPLPPSGLVPPSGLFAEPLDAAPLHPDLKSHAGPSPLPQRAAKADALAPGRQESARRRLASLRRGWLGGAGSGVAAALTPGPATWTPDPDETGFVPFPPGGSPPVGGERPSESSPSSAASDETRGASTGGRTQDARQDGATPAVPRAVALSSTTPAPADAIPIEVAAAPVVGGLPSSRLDARPGLTHAARISPEVLPTEEARRRYAALITPDNAEKEQRCLAEAVYFEARGEPEQGQAAVAQVVLNRAKSGLYPSNICGVVYQNRHRYLGCQFSFACEGRSLRITDESAWTTATRVAREVVEGRTYLADVGGATHYHADYVRPRWSRRLKKMDVIGRHIFYQLKPGQT